MKNKLQDKETEEVHTCTSEMENREEREGGREGFKL